MCIVLVFPELWRWCTFGICWCSGCFGLFRLDLLFTHLSVAEFPITSQMLAIEWSHNPIIPRDEWLSLSISFNQLICLYLKSITSGLKLEVGGSDQQMFYFGKHELVIHTHLLVHTCNSIINCHLKHSWGSRCSSSPWQTGSLCFSMRHCWQQQVWHQ